MWPTSLDKRGLRMNFEIIEVKIYTFSYLLYLQLARVFAFDLKFVTIHWEFCRGNHIILKEYIVVLLFISRGKVNIVDEKKS
jgi:hypothetical protein